MGKSKEEEKIEKTIRKLLKLPENRRCINCNSLGPQYVCTTFWTFVCTNCSGVHREFTHRVKSILMSRFFMEEIISLQAGGNEKARQVYFKTWDPLRNYYPDNSNVHQLREFIKHVYVDRYFTGEPNRALVSRSRNSDMHDPYVRQISGISESSSFHERYSDRYSRASYDELRSPQHKSRENYGYDVLRANSTHSEGTGVGYYQVDDPRHNPKYSTLRAKSSHFDSRCGGYLVDDPIESSKYGGLRSTSARFEGKNGGCHVDDTRIVGRGATNMYTTEDIKPRKSPDPEQRRDVHENASVRHVKEVLRENFLALRAANQPNFGDRRCVRTIASNQGGDYHRELRRGGDSSSTSYPKGHRRTVSAYVRSISESSQQSFNNIAETKPRSRSVRSLVDCEGFSSPDKTLQKASSQTRVMPKPPIKENASNAPAKNTLEYLLFELSTPEAKAPNDQSGIPDQDISTQQQGPATSTSEPQSLEVVPVSSSGSRDSSHDISRTTDGDKLTVATPQMFPDLLGDDDLPPPHAAVEHQNSSDPQYFEHSASIVPYNSSTAPQTSHFRDGTNYEPTTFSSAQRAPMVYENSFTHSTHQPSATEMQPSPEETKTGGRKELPADLFVSPYQLSSMPFPSSGWQTGPNYGMGFSMQYYPPQMPIAPFPTMAAKSTNPFDTDDNAAQPQVNLAQFASNGFVRSGLINGFNPSGMPHPSSFGSHLPLGGLPYQTSTPHQLPYASPGAYNMSQFSFHNMAPNSMQGTGGYGGEAGLHSNQPSPYIYQTPDQNSFSTGGNPFG